MRSFHLDFARRPFRDERPLFLAVAVALAISAGLLAVNIRLYRDFSREMEGTNRQIEYLEQRRARAVQSAERARAALNAYKVSTLARESRGLLKVIGERRFSWTGLLSRLERTLPPEVRVARMTPRFDNTGEATIDLGLVGKNADSVVRTIASLSRDPAFDAVNLRTESTPEAGVAEGHSFTLFVAYRPEGRP